MEPTLKAIVDKGLRTSPQGAFFLNADILPGPGFRWEGAVTIPAATFLAVKDRTVGSSAAQSMIGQASHISCSRLGPSGHPGPVVVHRPVRQVDDLADGQVAAEERAGQGLLQYRAERLDR